MDEPAVTLVLELVDRVWNRRDIDQLERFFADPFDHGGREDTLESLRGWHTADATVWAEPSYEVLETVRQGETIVIRWRATASHVGAWGPVHATERTVSWNGVHFFTVQGGRISRMWALADTFAKARQIGALD